MDSNILNTEFVFTSVPLVWFRTYHKILELLACYGERKVVNPNCKCTCNGNTVLECYDLFKSAVAAYNLGKKEEGNKIIKYIDCLLTPYETSNRFIATIDGKKYLFTEDDIILLSEEESDDEPPVVVFDDVYYGYFTPTTISGWQNTQEYIANQLTSSVLDSLTKTNITPITINTTIPKVNAVQIFVVLVPALYELSVKRDAGFGGKIDFEGSFWKANGNATIKINNITYKIYGQTYSTYGDITVYVK